MLPPLVPRTPLSPWPSDALVRCVTWSSHLMLVRLPGEAGLARHIALISQHMKAILPSLELQRQRKKCSISGHYVKRGKRKMYSWISSYLPHCFQGAQDLRDAFDISISLPLGCMAPSYTLWCRQGQYRSKIVFGRQQTWQLPTLGSMWSLQGAAGAPSSELLSHAVPYRQQAWAVGGVGWHS